MQPASWMFLVILACAASTSGEYLMGGHMDNNGSPKSLLEEIESSPSLARTAHLDDLDLDFEAEESTVGSSSSSDEESLRYHIPYPFAFNGGRPFSLEKDPITGKIDFEKAPPVKALNYTDRYRESADDGEEVVDKQVFNVDGISYSKKEKIVNREGEDVSPNEINPYSPNFHDFLNLPVHYSSDKYDEDKYPLISSSYANTKVQSGSNSYSTYNHKPYHRETVLYYPTRKLYVSKSTSTTTTTQRTMKPSTTTTITTTTTTSAPIKTTTTSVPPSTTVYTSTKAPIVTTWKPPVTSMKHPNDYMDHYQDILPIEKLQSSVYNKDHRQGSNNVPQHDRDPQTRPTTVNEEYTDNGYDDYEINDEESEKDYDSSKESTNEPFKTSTMPAATTYATNATTSETPQTTSSTTATAATLMPVPLSTVHASPMPQGNFFPGNTLQLSHQHPATSMPLGNNPLVSPGFDSVVDNRRVSALENDVIHSGYRPNQIINQRPSGMAGGILVESTSNIVIPPDQDTVSFVLGNRQNVEGGYYSLGTAIGESPYNGPSGIDASFRPLYGAANDGKDSYDAQADHRGGTIGLPPMAVVETNPNYGAQNWRQPNPPTAPKLANAVEPSRTQNSFVKGTVLTEQEADRKEEKDHNYVVFPTEESRRPIEEHVVVINEADGSIREIPPSSTTPKPIPDQAMPYAEGLPQLAENLTPPAERPRPPTPFYQQHHHHHHHHPQHPHPGTARPDYPRPQRLPSPPRGKPPSTAPLPPSPESVGIRRRPYSPDANLPNILPQFRPNAKTSHGHRGSETVGTIPAGQTFASRVRQPVQSHPPPRRPLPPAPSYLQRLNPPPPPIHAIRLTGASSSMAESAMPPRESEISSNVKRFRPPIVPGATSRGDDDAKSVQANRLPVQKLRLEDEERSERYSEEPPQTPPRPPFFPKRRTADSPHIATLQMIQQHHGEFEEESAGPNLLLTPETNSNNESERIITEPEADRRKFDNHEAIAEPPVYVVYPVNTAVNIHPDDSGEKDESVVVGTHGPHRPLPPETLLQDSGDEIQEEESSPLHGIFSGRPVAPDFPYPLERPDPSILANRIRETPLLVPSDQRQHEKPASEINQEKDDKDNSVNIIPYLQDFVPFPARKNEPISATLHRLPSLPSSTPIAFVYTPSAQASHRLDMDLKDDEHPKIDRNDEKPVLLPSQQPSSSSSSAPSPQNFMAPFVASVSAEAPAKNGWSVVVVEPTADRKSDEGDEKAENLSDAEVTQTEKNEFDVENFKPQLFGGFKPIYEFPSEDGERPESRGGTDTNADMSSMGMKETGNSTV